MWHFAFTMFAKAELIAMSATIFLTAVAAVPLASLNVVFIVADSITLEIFDRAIRFLERRVRAPAFITVLELLRIASLLTTVTAIPATAAVVVIVITVFVTLVVF